VYLGVRFVRVAPGARLPFADGHFDITFSNAVIEHVGSRNRQRLFLEEMLRVSRRFFIATPNRWFVIEPHTGLPFLHYLPAAAFRRVLRHTRYRFWSEESNLNLLSRMDLLRLFPTEVRPILDWVGIGWGSCKSNLVAYGWSHDASE
jgi:SAM-dependent methyltransferase